MCEMFFQVTPNKFRCAYCQFSWIFLIFPKANGCNSATSKNPLWRAVNRPYSGTLTPGSALRAGATRRSPAKCVVVLEGASLRSALFPVAGAWFGRRAQFFVQQVLLLPRFVDAFSGNVCVVCENVPSVSRQQSVPGVDINVSPNKPFDWPRDHPQ